MRWAPETARHVHQVDIVLEMQQAYYLIVQHLSQRVRFVPLVYTRQRLGKIRAKHVWRVTEENIRRSVVLQIVQNVKRDSSKITLEALTVSFVLQEHSIRVVAYHVPPVPLGNISMRTPRLVRPVLFVKPDENFSTRAWHVKVVRQESTNIEIILPAHSANSV